MTPPKEKQIDDLDAGIISRLQIDGRTSNTELAKALKVSEATIRTRLKRLTDDNIIQIVAVSNPFKLGFEVTGDLNIRVDMKKMDNVIAALKGFNELWYIVVTTGACNINAEFVVKNLAGLHDLVYNRLSLIDGIEQIDTSIIMKYIKRKYDFGTPFN
ncbi:MAG: Lrp/AsnC family transcriptional regulator [Leptospirales bacterium]|nr:Lrp/AsnC family transcriptional regulator [Leptospirales bacterium]